MIHDPYRQALEERRSLEHRQALALALLFALLLHIPLLQAAAWVTGRSGPTDDFAPLSITEVSLLEGLDETHELSPAEQEVRKERLDDENDLNGRIVMAPPPRNPTPHPSPETKKDAYLASHDNHTKTPTKNRGDPRAGEKSEPQPSTPPREAPANAVVEVTPPEMSEPPTLDPMDKVDAPPLREGSTTLRFPRAAQPNQGRRPSYEALLPPALGEFPGIRGTDDYLPEIPEGSETSLNTRQFKYWSFFERVRSSIKRNWQPAHAWRRSDPTGQVYGIKDRLTVLGVRLNADGTLKDVSVLQQSGMAPLDDEALRAFRAAEPFPNPPPGLVSKDGDIAFTYGLFLDIQSGWDFRPIRIAPMR